MRDDMAAVALDVWMKSVQQTVERELDAVLPSPQRHPQRLHAAMRYAVLGGGKRTRPLLVFAAGVACGAPEHALVRAAVAVELVHAYSLIHDDLPCMDDDVLRRGRPTTHVAFDEATALLAGDALQTLAFEVLSDAPVSAQQKVDMVGLLARASGAGGMAGGQAIDLANVGQAISLEALETMHRLKTGALLSASVGLGALCADDGGVNVRASLDVYSASVGLAFQVVDDILDVDADTATLGKTAGKDAEHNKPTYVALMGLERAKGLAEELRVQAHAAIEPIGASGNRLGQLADFVVLRKH